MIFNSESLSVLKPFTTMLGISQHYASGSYVRHIEISMAVILMWTHKVYQNSASYRHINTAIQLQIYVRGIAHLSSDHYNWMYGIYTLTAGIQGE